MGYGKKTDANSTFKQVVSQKLPYSGSLPPNGSSHDDSPRTFVKC